MRYLLLLNIFLLSLNASAQISFHKIYSAPWIGQGTYVKSEFSKSSDGVYTLVGSSSGITDSLILFINSDNTQQPTFVKRVYSPLLGPTSINQRMDLYCFSDLQVRLLFNSLTTSYLLKTTNTGNLTSVKKINQSSTQFYKLFEIDGFLYGAGIQNNSGMSGGLICKMDMDANVISSHYINSGSSQRRSIVYQIKKTNDGGFLIAGEDFNPSVSAHASLMLIRTDSLMNMLWQHHYSRPQPFSGNMIPKAIVEIPHGGFMLLIDNAVNYYSGIMLTDITGNVISYTSYNSTNPTLFPNLFSLSYFDENTIITAGHINSAIGNTVYTPIQLSLDTIGQLTGTREFPVFTTDGYFATDVDYEQNNGLLMSSTRTFPGGTRANIIRTDTLLEINCPTPAYTLNPVSYSTIDSGFVFSIITTNVTTSDVTSQFNLAPVTISTTNNCVATSLAEPEAKKQSISLFPNPATKEIQVDAKSGLIIPGATYRITDQTGRCWITGEFKSSATSIDIQQLSSGVYLFEMENQGIISKSKFIKTTD